jgi:hypothetical protein
MILFHKYGFPEIMRMSDTQGAAEPDAGGAAPPGGDGGGAEPFARDPLDTERSKGRMGIRESLEKGFSDARKTPVEERPSRGGKEGRFAAGGPKAKGAGESAEGAATDTDADKAASPAAVVDGGGEAAAAGDAAKLALPATLKNNAEAAAEWEKSPALAAAYARREEEMAKGVEKLKAAHAEVDTAIAPHAEAIRRHGHTPGQAVSQLFSWFQSLAANPKVAFPALLQSFNAKPEDIFPQLAGRAAAPVAQQAAAAVAGDQAPPGGQQAAPAFELPPEYKQLMDGTFQKMTALEQQVQQFVTSQQAQQQRATEQIVGDWSKGKPHFERVRGQMAKLIQSGVVGLKADGGVDLDGAYEAAVYADPELRGTMMQAEQKKAQDAAAARVAAEQKAQADAAAKARAASKSLAPSAPGASPVNGAAQQRKKGESVRESIARAREEVASRA